MTEKAYHNPQYQVAHHSGFGANLYRFSSKHEINFFQSEWSVIVNLRKIQVNISLKISPAPLSQGLCMPFFIIFFIL